MTVAVIAGTRPEAIKLAPVLRRLRRRPDIATTMIATGQHPAMLHEALAEFDLAADVDLAVPNVGLDFFCRKLEAALPPLLDRLSPDLVLVQGDTSSAWVAARAAHARSVPVGHIEAGLRSGDPDQPWPEERNRADIDALATLLFAPCAVATAALASHSGAIHLTGNTGIDAFLETVAEVTPRRPDRATRHILVTCHRREAIPRLPDLARALLLLAVRDDIRIRLPLHPNPAVGDTLARLLGDHPRIALRPALPYRALVALLADADLLLTDSGGLQEEAPAIGLPTLVLRDVTERPEPVASGNAILVGLDPTRIVAETTRLIDDPRAYAAMSRPSFPYGNGDASERIVEAIEEWWNALSPSGERAKGLPLGPPLPYVPPPRKDR